MALMEPLAVVVEAMTLQVPKAAVGLFLSAVRVMQAAMDTAGAATPAVAAVAALAQ